MIGSTNFEEQAIVSNIWADVLEKAGYKVTVEPSLGTRAIVVPALERGRSTSSPTTPHPCWATSTAGIPSRPVTRFKPPSPPTKRRWPPTASPCSRPLPLLDTNVFAVTQATAKKDHLTTISSLKPYASKARLGRTHRVPHLRRP